MREITIRIRKLTPDELKKVPGDKDKKNKYAVIFVGKEKMCEHCGERVECLMGSEKCQAYHADGKKVLHVMTTIEALINWAKELCGEL